MIIEEKDGYTLISQKKTTSFEYFIKNFIKEHKELEKKNLILSLLEDQTFKSENFSVLLNCSQLHGNNGTTFVVICKNVDIDQFPESFNIVPTLTEAIDVLEMENIQRELGF